eukprot:767965-Hanusia_phi.AAC.2
MIRTCTRHCIANKLMQIDFLMHNLPSITAAALSVHMKQHRQCAQHAKLPQVLLAWINGCAATTVRTACRSAVAVDHDGNMDKWSNSGVRVGARGQGKVG